MFRRSGNVIASGKGSVNNYQILFGFERNVCMACGRLERFFWEKKLKMKCIEIHCKCIERCEHVWLYFGKM